MEWSHTPIHFYGVESYTPIHFYGVSIHTHPLLWSGVVHTHPLLWSGWHKFSSGSHQQKVIHGEVVLIQEYALYINTYKYLVFGANQFFLILIKFKLENKIMYPESRVILNLWRFIGVMLPSEDYITKQFTVLQKYTSP